MEQDPTSEETPFASNVPPRDVSGSIAPIAEELGIPPPHESAGDWEAQSAPERIEREAYGEAAKPEAAGQPQAFFSPSVDLIIEGIEATQATQFYKSSRHLHAPHAEPDNSVPLVERKHLAIRVYPDLRIRWPWSIWIQSLPVDGDVWFRRIDVPDTYKKASRLNSQIQGQRALSIDRGDSNHTLNFRISDLYTHGRLVVYARTWITLFGKRRYSPWFGRIFGFTSVPHIRIRAHGVHYQRGAIDKPAPTLSDFLATGVYLRKTFPMSRFDFLSYDVINFGGDLTDTSGGGCGQGWNQLWNLLQNLYTLTGQDANHYALMQTGIPTAYGGCGGGNVGASFVGGGSVMAQELGHGLGLNWHVPGCNAGSPNPNYPHYTHPITASIGEYGTDYATGKVYDPKNSNDFMSYCPNPWVSPYVYRELINGINNQPTPAPAPTESDTEDLRRAEIEDLRRPEEHLYLAVRVSCVGEVKLIGGFRMVGPPSRAMGRSTPHTVKILDAEGRTLVMKELKLQEAHQENAQAEIQVTVGLPIHEGASKLVFNCGHHDDPTQIETTEIDIPQDPIKVELKSAKPAKSYDRTAEGLPSSDSIRLEWAPIETIGPHEKIRYTIRFSNGKENNSEENRLWKPLAIGLESTNYTVYVKELPSGVDCRLQVMANTNLRSATAETPTFKVEKMARTASISPIPDPDRPSHHVELAGAACSPDGCAAEEDLKWYSNIQGHLGIGSYLIANNLVPGEHVITLVAPDDLGGEARADYRIQILPSPGPEVI